MQSLEGIVEHMQGFVVVSFLIPDTLPSYPRGGFSWGFPWLSSPRITNRPRGNDDTAMWLELPHGFSLARLSVFASKLSRISPRQMDKFTFNFL